MQKGKTMLLECNECQIIVQGAKAPFVCPNCGLAGVKFAPISEKEVAQRVAEGDHEPINLDRFVPPASPSQQPRIR
jgi:hypothetical protein